MGDFEQLIHDIQAEAQAEGPAAVAELAALEARFSLAAELIARRTGLGMTQKQLASASGIGQSEISRIERGEINADGPDLRAPAAAPWRAAGGRASRLEGRLSRRPTTPVSGGWTCPDRLNAPDTA